LIKIAKEFEFDLNLDLKMKLKKERILPPPSLLARSAFPPAMA